jgi:biopolymer transport protein ExbD
MRLRVTQFAPTLRSSFVVLLPLLTLVFSCGYIYLWDLSARSRGDYIADFVLPYARSATPDESPDGSRLEICIPRDGTLRVLGEPRTDEEIERVLEVEARLSRERGSRLSNRMLYFRADERVPFKHILKIMRWCSRDEVRIGRLCFWTRPHE